jgi:sulfur carrier protein ThiS adenylyltransferase
MTRNDIFERNPPGVADALREKTVGIAGCGGLGSNAAVALTRAGIGHLIIADHDVVEPSNLNRQHYFASDVGKPKVEALAVHLRSINPDLDLTTYDCELTPDDLDDYFRSCDILIEAFDRAESKLWLLRTWAKLHPERPIICGNGLSGTSDTATLTITNPATNAYFCGDGATDMSMGLSAPRVAIVANMQASVAIDLLLGKTPS